MYLTNIYRCIKFFSLYTVCLSKTLNQILKRFNFINIFHRKIILIEPERNYSKLSSDSYMKNFHSFLLFPNDPLHKNVFKMFLNIITFVVFALWWTEISTINLKNWTSSTYKFYRRRPKQRFNLSMKICLHYSICPI